MSPLPLAASLEVRSDLGSWCGAWDDLVERQPLPSPFQRSWWLAALAPQTTTFVLVRDGETLLGGVALGVRRRLGVTRYSAPGASVLCPDHLDALAAPGAEDPVAVALASWFNAPGQRVADVRGIVADSLLARAVGGRTESVGVAPYQRLSDDGYLTTRSSSFRRSVRRGRRRLEELGFTHRRIAPDEVPAALADLRRLHAPRDGRAALLRELDTIDTGLLAGVRCGEARVDVLASDGDVAAVTLAFELAGRLSLYQVARSTAPEHASAGTVLLAAVIEDAAAGGQSEVDLLRGDEGYKRSFADHVRPVLRVRSASGAWAGALLRAEDLARGANAVRVSAMPRSRVP